VLWFSLGIAVDSWTDPIPFQALCEFLQSFFPNAMQESEHPGGGWLSVV
jgi:hypothetical protein